MMMEASGRMQEAGSQVISQGVEREDNKLNGKGKMPKLKTSPNKEDKFAC